MAILLNGLFLPVGEVGSVKGLRSALIAGLFYTIQYPAEPEFLKVTVTRSCDRAKSSDFAQNLEIYMRKLKIYAF